MQCCVIQRQWVSRHSFSRRVRRSPPAKTRQHFAQRFCTTCLPMHSNNTPFPTLPTRTLRERSFSARNFLQNTLFCSSPTFFTARLSSLFPTCFEIALSTSFNNLSLYRLLAYVVLHVSAFVFSPLSHTIVLAMFSKTLTVPLTPWTASSHDSLPTCREHSAHNIFHTHALRYAPLLFHTTLRKGPSDSTWNLWNLRQLSSFMSCSILLPSLSQPFFLPHRSTVDICSK